MVLTSGIPNRRPEKGESLTREEFSLTPGGVQVRIARAQRRVPADGVSYDTAPWETAWLVHIDRSTAFSLSWDSTERGSQQVHVVTAAEFEFDPAVEGAEDDALERARRYAVDVAHVIAGLRPALEGLVERAEAEITESARRHAAFRLNIGGGRSGG